MSNGTPNPKNEDYPFLSKTSSGIALNYESQNATNTKQLPLVASGPILRLVVTGSVTVWLAMFESVDLRLKVFEADQTNGSKKSASPVLTTGSWTTPQKVGDNLHVQALTADEGTLSENTLYTYEVEFKTSSGTKTLDQEGILQANASGLDPISPGNHERPTFSVPSQADDVNLFYGSCRKPHGQRRDALPAVRERLKQNGLDPTNRPHFLVLGGDQIYADDVADSLFAMLWNFGDFLLGAEEKIPNTDDPSNYDSELATFDEFSPDHRQSLVNEVAQLSAGGEGTPHHRYGTSHLLGLGEYMAMYLCVWSDVLWPAAGTLDAALPTKKELYDDGDDIPDHIPDDRVTSYENGTAFGNAFAPEVEERDSNVANLEYFRQALPNVRPVLASVPTLMIWDDHDVTDDWFLDGGWVQKVLESPMGHRVIQNGMIAANICQIWGNNPDVFASGSGKMLLDTVESGVGGGMATDGPWDKSTTETVDALLGIPTMDEASDPNDDAAWNRPNGSRNSFTYPKSEDRIRYPFAIYYPDFLIVILDTRTFRGYPDPYAPPQIIKPEKLSFQIPSAVHLESVYEDRPGFGAWTRDNPMFVVSPVPTFAVPTLEIAQWVKQRQYELKDADWFPMSDLHDPVLPNEKNDLEHWRHQPAAMDFFLMFLVRMSANPIILSGDVHHGYSSRAEWWGMAITGDLEPEEFHAVVPNLVSSPLKNETEKPRLLHEVGYVLDRAYAQGGWLKRDMPDAVESVATYLPVLDFHDHAITTEYYIEGSGIGYDGIEHAVAIFFPDIESKTISFETPIPVTVPGMNTTFEVTEAKGQLFIKGETLWGAVETSVGLPMDQQDFVDALQGAATSAAEAIKERYVDHYTTFMNFLQSGADPDWQYRIDYLLARDRRNYSQQQSVRGRGTEIVGHNNVGQVRLQKQNGRWQAVHRLWWHENGLQDGFVGTEWLIDLVSDDPGEQRDKPFELIQDTYSVR
jgi:hypothetical protein